MVALNNHKFDGPKFPLGKLICTEGAAELITRLKIKIMNLIGRHITGDWGDIDDEDVHTNNCALLHGDRLLSSYNIDPVSKLWIITEADRSRTTILLPSEY